MQSTSLLLIALVTGGVAGAGSAFLVGSQSSPTTSYDVAAAPDDGADLDALRAENDQMRSRLKDIEAEMASLRQSRRESVASSNAPALADNLDLDAIQDMLAAMNAPNQPAPAGLARLVDQAIVDREQREKDAKEAEDLAKREERMDERIADMSTKLGLDNVQAKSVRDALWNKDEMRSELWTQARNGEIPGGRDEIRGMMEDLNENADLAIQQALSPAQWEQYQEEYDNGGGRGGFDRGGGGDRGGDRGGRGR